MFGWWEHLRCFPSTWQHMLQVHIPKTGAEGSRGNQPASKLRPISLLSAWWRMYVRARLAGPAEEAWLADTLQPGQHGGCKDRDGAAAFMDLAECYARGQYVGTLDLSKAFDHITPERAVCFLTWHGFPEALCQAIQQLWGSQKRYLMWHGHVLPQIQEVQTSIPQGDGLSPRIMNLLLAVPLRVISQAIRSATHVVFVDDRSWAAPALTAFCGVLRLWKEHSLMLGLRENDRKAQFTHKRAAQRRDMRQHQEIAGAVKDHLVALGAVLGFGKPVDVEEQRIDKAKACAAKVASAPTGPRAKVFVASCAASTKAAYGWLARSPPKTLVSKTETRLRRAGYCHRLASPALIRLVLGHGQDVLYQAGAAACLAVVRQVLRTGHAPRDWGHTGGPAKRLRQWLGTMGWSEQGPWQWSHPGIGSHLCVDPAAPGFSRSPKAVAHALREAWRHHWWGRYITSPRHEVLEALQGVPYDPRLAKSAQAQAGHPRASTHEVAVMVGAFCSPAMFGRATGKEEKCPWCHTTNATFEHVTWQCSEFPGPRPPRPAGLVQRRLGWGSPEWLRHLAKVRQAVLHSRHGAGGEAA